MAVQNNVGTVIRGVQYVCLHSSEACLLHIFISLLFIWAPGREEEDGILGRDNAFRLCNYPIKCSAKSRF